MSSRLLIEHPGGEPVGVDAGPGFAWMFSARAPGKESANEDAAVVFAPDPGRAALAVADGVGGHRAGSAASKLAVSTLAERLAEEKPAEETLRTAILDSFERANRAVCDLGVGAATTFAVAEVGAGFLRPYHVGDSEIWVVGQRGKLKLQTLSHSPVGYAVESGLLSEDEALAHEDRHLVSNFVGSEEMRIDIGSTLRLAPRDTVLIGSDGLFDNLTQEEIIATIRSGPLDRAAARLAEGCQQRMGAATGISKPDDLTFILFRLSH